MVIPFVVGTVTELLNPSDCEKDQIVLLRTMETAEERRSRLKKAIREKQRAARSGQDKSSLLAKQVLSDPTGAMLSLGVDDADVLSSAPELVRQIGTMCKKGKGKREKERKGDESEEEEAPPP